MWLSEVVSRRLVLAACTALVGGCGFQLRQPPPLQFRSIALTGFAPRSPLAEELARVLSQRVRMVPDAAAAEVVLHALTDARERIAAALTTAAQVRDLSLRVRLQYRVHTPSGRELLPTSVLLLARDMSFNETQVLAKEQEEAEIYREMQSDVVAQVMRRLASIKL